VTEGAAMESTVYYWLCHILYAKMFYHVPRMSLNSRALQIFPLSLNSDLKY